MVKSKASELTKVSDSIEFKSISTGGQSVGNGGDGKNYGDITSKPTINFNPSNKADGSTVNVTTGDNVHQKASWDADAGNAKASKFSKAYGGDAKSNGDQSSSSGYDTSKVYANTTADQTNKLWADQSQHVMAGIGGDGGSNNIGWGGDVNLTIDTSI